MVSFAEGEAGMKRIEMTVASCGECPFAYSEDWSGNYQIRCSHPGAKGSAIYQPGGLDVSDNWKNLMPRDCPLPDAGPDPIAARLEAIENAIRALTARLPPPTVRLWWKSR